MNELIVYMSMSLGGFIAAADDCPGRGLGVRGRRLFDDRPAETHRLRLVRSREGDGAHLRYHVMGLR